MEHNFTALKLDYEHLTDVIILFCLYVRELNEGLLQLFETEEIRNRGPIGPLERGIGSDFQYISVEVEGFTFT